MFPLNMLNTPICGGWEEAPLYGAGGSATYDACGSGGTVSLSASGFAGSPHQADRQYMVWQTLCGNGALTIRLDQLPGSGWAGIELRGGTDAGAVKVSLGRWGTMGVIAVRQTHGGSAFPQNFAVSGRNWLRLTRSGQQFVGHTSLNGTSWVQAFAVSVADMPACAEAGLYVKSPDNGTVTAVASQVGYTGFAAPPTTVSFAQPSLTAMAGDTVQVCLTIAGACPCAATTAQVALAGDGQPHLAGYATQVVTFPAGTAGQQCFGLAVGAAPSNGGYTLELQGLSGGNAASVGAQGSLVLSVTGLAMGHCGVAPPMDASAYPDEVPVTEDRFGNEYVYSQLLAAPRPSPSTPSEGAANETACGCDDLSPAVPLSLFNLHFEDCHFNTGAGFAAPGDLGPARRRVLCAAFQYLEGMITANGPVCPDTPTPVVNVRVQPSVAVSNYFNQVLSGFAQNSPVLGFASPYMAEQLVNPGILYGVPQTIINSGAYPPPFSAATMHGLVRFNFNQPFWLDFESPLPTFNPDLGNIFFDLYSVALHEAMHMLGFFSSFASQGAGQGSTAGGLGKYFPFDKHLSLDYPEGHGHLIANDPPGPSDGGLPRSPRWRFNPAANPAHLHSSCLPGAPGPDMHFMGSDGATYPVFTGGSFEDGRSFSHLVPDCGGAPAEQYVMLPSFTANAHVTRVLHPHEVDIMRRIGYCFGHGPANGCAAVGAAPDGMGFGCADFDFTLSVCPPTVSTLSIPLAVLLANDPNATGIAYIEPIGATGHLSADGQSYELRVDRLGEIVLQYAVLGPDGECANSSSVRIRVTWASGCEFECPDFMTCAELNYSAGTCREYWGDADACEDIPTYDCGRISSLNPCNLICNSEFCGTVRNTNADGLTSVQSLINLPGWIRTHGVMQYYAGRFSDVAENCNPSVSLSHAALLNSGTGGVMSPVDLGAGNRYLLKFGHYRSINSPIVSGRLRIDLIQREMITITNPIPDQPSNPDYFGVIQSIFLPSDPLPVNQVYGAVFTTSSTADWPGFDAIWLQSISPHFTQSRNIDDVELTEDNFTAGPDQGTTFCGETVQLGGPFCMLSDLGVQYEWFVVGPGGEVQGAPIASYRVRNTVASEIVGNLDATTLELTVAPAQTTTYRLRRSIYDLGGLPATFGFCRTEPDGTATTDCLYEDDVTVSVAIPFPDAGFDVSSAGCVLSFTSHDPTPGLEHHWDFGIAGLSATVANPSGIVLPNGEHLITHTVTSPCGQAVHTQTVTVAGCLSCADCDAATTIGAHGQVTLLSAAIQANPMLLPPNAAQGLQACVAGTLVIDQDYVFTNSYLFILEGASVEVPEGKALVVLTSRLEGCGRTWRGIEMAKGSTLRMANSRVSDAQYALYLHPSASVNEPMSSISVWGNKFYDNFVGVLIPPTAYGRIDGLYIDGNEFARTTPALLPPYTGQTSVPEGLPAQNVRPLAGIVAHDFGLLSTSNNTFAGLASGIVGRRAALLSNGDSFDAITDEAALYPGYEERGACLHAKGAGHPVRAIGGDFRASTLGIVSMNTALLAEGNTIDEVQVGIFAFSLLPLHVRILDNEVANGSFGIWANHISPMGQLDIVGNNVQTPPQTAVGIALLSNRATALLEGNKVDVMQAGNGIYLQSCNKGTLRDNQVHLHAPAAAQAGITLSATEKYLLKDNTVTGGGTTGPGNIALRIASSPGNVYCCNTLSNTRIGAYVTGGSLATDNFRGTSFSNHAASLQLPDVNAILGPQTHAQNCWAANAGPAVYGADASNPVPLNFAEQYPFTADPDILSCFMPASHTPMGWFRSVEDTEYGGAVCALADCGTEMFAPESDDVKRVAMGDTAVAPAVMWELQRYIHERLQGETVQDLSILAFLAQADTSCIGAFHATGQSVTAILAAESAAMAALQANLGLSEEKLDSIALVDILLAGADSTEAAALWGTRSGLAVALDELVEENLGLAVQCMDFIAVESERLRSKNDDTAATGIYEVNEKEVNDLHLSWLGNALGTLDSIGMTALRAIAEQCPVEGGNAVYRARALLSILVRDHVHYDDGMLCAPIQALAMPSAAPSGLTAARAESGLRISPNPASNEIKLAWGQPAESPGLVQVSDIFGRQVWQSAIAAGASEQVVQLTGLPEGVYVFRIRLNGKDAVRKVLVQR